MIGLGTLINGASVVAGGIVGLFAGKLFKKQQRNRCAKYAESAYFSSLSQARWRVC